MKKFKLFLLPYCLLMLSAANLNVFASEHMLVPGGNTIGITVSTNGLTVINTAEFSDENGILCSPAKEAGLRGGDIILKINGCEVNSVAELEKSTDKSESLDVLYKRDGYEHTTKITPKRDLTDGKFRIGIWIKDSASGIGTMTYYDPTSGNFGALGHGICSTNEDLIEIRGGEILKAEITSIRRGEKGAPGELIGIFGDKKDIIGNVEKNTADGVFGHTKSKKSENLVEVAERCEVKEGAATILCNVESEAVREYSVKIVKINDDEESSKGMIIKITDSDLLEKTGGIVRGMSGSPILQNGKLVGAVTHVFVNDPTRGYGIFIENMLKEAEK